MSEVIPAEFARLCGVGPAVICRKIKNNTLTRNSAGLIDTDSLVNARYMERRRRRRAAALAPGDASSGTKSASPAAPGASSSWDEEFDEEERYGLPSKMLGMTIRELVLHCGSQDGIDRYVRNLRDLAAADEKTQRVQERRGTLVQKTAVADHVFLAMDLLMKKLLEYPRAAIDSIVASVLADESTAREKIVGDMSREMTEMIKETKEGITDALAQIRKGGKGEDEKIGITAEDIKEEIRAAIEEA